MVNIVKTSILICLVISIISRNLEGGTTEVHVKTDQGGTTFEKYYHVVIPIALTIACVVLLITIIVTFCKVPLRKRQLSKKWGERFKWFIKALCFQIFLPFYIVHYLLKMFFSLLDCMCPDTKNEPVKYEEKSENRSKFVEMKEEI